MEYSKSLVLLCMLYFLIINGIESTSIQIYPDKEGIIESSDLQLICNYTVERTDLVQGSNIQVKINNTFVTIASFEKDSNGGHPKFASNGIYLSLRANLSNPTPSFPHTVILTFLPIKCEDEKEYMCSVTEKIDGAYPTTNSNSISIVVKASFQPNVRDPTFVPDRNDLSSRVNLSNPTPSFPNTVILTFNRLECEDEREYKCKVTTKYNNDYSTVISNATSIVVKGKPAKPDNVPTWIPESGIEEGTDVTFTCTGNVGKPAGRFKWTKYSGSTQTVYNNATNTAENMPGTCTFNGTSMLTIKLEAEDNNAVIKCEVVQELATSDMFKQSRPDDLVVYCQPAKPDNVPTWIPESMIEEGTYVNFTCTGNVGSPAGKFKWTKYRGSTTTVYNNATNTAEKMPGTCTFNGTSMLIIKLEAEDNNAIIKCEVVQELATSDMFKQSRPDDLVVYYKVRNIQITKSPNLSNYAEGATSITLYCSAEGNPAPTFTWHKAADINTTLVTGMTFTLLQKDVIVTNTGNYVCVGKNTFNGKQHELTTVQHIQIGTDPTSTKPPQTNNDEPSLSTGGIVGIVVGVLCAIVIIVIVIWCLRKRRNQKDESIDEPPEKPRNNLSYIEKQDALGDKNGPSNNQINYADFSFEDRPRSRKPLQLSHDADLNQTQYADVMMPRV